MLESKLYLIVIPGLLISLISNVYAISNSVNVDVIETRDVRITFVPVEDSDESYIVINCKGVMVK